MTQNEKILAKINQRLDGELSEAEEQALAQALAAEPALASESKRLERVVAEMAALDESIEPERDLWPEIESRLEIESPTGSERRPWLAAAALAATIVLAFVAGRMSEPDPPPSFGSALAIQAVDPAVARASSSGLPPNLTEASTSLERTRIELRRAFEARRDELPPATLALVERNLATIERAMSEIEQALVDNPTDRELGRTLLAYQTREIQLLERAQRAAARL